MNEFEENNLENQPQPQMKVVERGKGKKGAGGQKFREMVANIFIYGMFMSIGLTFFGIGLYILIGAIMDGEANDPLFGAFLFLPGMFIFFGLCAIIAGFFVGHKFLQRSAFKKLKKTGRGTCMPIESITTNNSSINHVPGYIITVKNEKCESGFMRKYTSKPTYDAKINIFQEGDMMPIYVDKEEPSKFYMDIDAAYQQVLERVNNEFFK